MPSSCIRSLASLLLPPPGHLLHAWHGITIGSSGEIVRGRVHVRLLRSLVGVTFGLHLYHTDTLDCLVHFSLLSPIP